MKKILLEEIKDKAYNLLHNSSIRALTGEKQIIDTLDKISKINNTDINLEYLENTVNFIERYIMNKEKMLISQEDYDYLTSLAKELKEQTTRKTDVIMYIPLFKITNIDKEERYFLTRESACEFMKLHNDTYSSDTEIEIEEMNNTNLLKLIEIIKRNF